MTTAPAVDPQGFRALAASFVATRGSANTRAAYARDLRLLGEALGIDQRAVEIKDDGGKA